MRRLRGSAGISFSATTVVSFLEAWPRQFVGTGTVSDNRQLWPPRRLLQGFLDKERKKKHDEKGEQCSQLVDDYFIDGGWEGDSMEALGINVAETVSAV